MLIVKDQQPFPRFGCQEKAEFETMPESSSLSSSAVKRACDACHRRKVKCIGDGPKGSRAKVISGLRESQRQSQLSLSPHRHGLDNPPGSLSFSCKPGLISMELITTCVDYYFENLYDTMPILHRQRITETIRQMETNPEAYCLLVSLCGYILIQPNIEVPRNVYQSLDVKPQSNIQLGRWLLAETTRVRKRFDYVDSPSVWSVLTSFFLYQSYFCLDIQGNAWFHLREATTLAITMGMHEESSYINLDIIDTSRRRRLYWLLFINERAYALRQHRPLSLHATISLPTIQEDPSETAELGGFLQLINLFTPFDDTFVGLWNKARTGCTTEWLARLQQQLSDALPVYLQNTEAQAVDLKFSQQWLRTMVWQLSISHGFLSSAAAENSLSFKFPIEIARDLVTATTQFSQHSMGIHGIGLVEKLFDISCTLVDVISCVPYEQQSFEYGPQEYLHQIMALISNLRGGQQRYMPLLVSKINDTMPNAINYGLPASVPTSASSRASDAYGGSQHERTIPRSSESTPFGSPTLSAIENQLPIYGGFSGLDVASSAASFAGMIVMTGIDYGDLAVPAPAHMFPEDSIYPTAESFKFYADR